MRLSRLVFLLPLITVLGLAALTASAQPPAASTLSWADVEPAVESCFALVDDGHGGTYASFESTALLPTAATLPRAVRRSVASSCEMAGLRVALAWAQAEDAARAVAAKDGRAAGTTALRTTLFADARTARVLRSVVAGGLKRDRINCSDCHPESQAARSVSTADFLPYLTRLCYVSADDVPAKVGGRGGFHICSGTNDLTSLDVVDRDLAEVALAALYSVVMEGQDEAFREIVHRAVEAACGDNHGTVTSEQLKAINAELQARLSASAEYLDALRPALEKESRLGDLECGDCARRKGAGR